MYNASWASGANMRDDTVQTACSEQELEPHEIDS